MVGYERSSSCSIRLILPSHRTKVTIKSRCSAVRCAMGPPEKRPSMDVSQDEQCSRVISNSDLQTGHRVGVAYIGASKIFRKIYHKINFQNSKITFHNKIIVIFYNLSSVIQ